MNLLVSCLVVYVPVATLVVFLFWIFLVKGPLEFVTTLYWVAASAIGASMILGPGFARGSLRPPLKQRIVFVLVGLALLVGIILYVSYGFEI